jgi:hypothetical protein
MKDNKVVIKRVSPDVRIKAKRVSGSSDVIIKRVKSIKPMRRDSQDGSTD